MVVIKFQGKIFVRRTFYILQFPKILAVFTHFTRGYGKLITMQKDAEINDSKPCFSLSQTKPSQVAGVRHMYVSIKYVNSKESLEEQNIKSYPIML